MGNNKSLFNSILLYLLFLINTIKDAARTFILELTLLYLYYSILILLLLLILLYLLRESPWPRNLECTSYRISSLMFGVKLLRIFNLKINPVKLYNKLNKN